MQATTENSMVKITTALVVTNRIDQANAEDGVIPEERVRSVTLNNSGYRCYNLVPAS